MNPVKVIIGFVPLFVFSMLAHVVPVGWAAAAGLAAAIVVVVATARGGVKILPVAQVVLLLGMAVLGFTGGWLVDAVLKLYGQGIVGLLLGAFMIVSAPVAPFTAQFARSTVPPKLWYDARFLEVNRRISTVWGIAVLTLGLCHLLAAQLYVAGLPAPVWLAVAWVVPTPVFIHAGRYTTRTAAAAHEAATGHEPQQRTAS